MRSTVTSNNQAFRAAWAVGAAAALLAMSACGRLPLPNQQGAPVTTVGTVDPSPTATMPPTASVAAPVPTGPAVVPTMPPNPATQGTTIATPPPGNRTNTGGTRIQPGSGSGSNRTAGPVVSTTGDWGNATYPISCLDSANGPVVLSGGSQGASSANSEVYAELWGAVDAGGGSTVVWIFCEASSRVNGLHAVLVSADGTMTDDVAVGPVDQLDGLWYTAPLYEPWQSGDFAWDAASMQAHQLSVNGGSLYVNDGEITPKCAPLGPEWFEYGPGRVSQGNLVREFQSRLVDLGYGAEIQATGGVDGSFGRGTMEAFNRYFADNFDYNDMSYPASWLGNEDGFAWVNWLDIGWTQVLGLNCVGEYQPPEG